MMNLNRLRRAVFGIILLTSLLSLSFSPMGFAPVAQAEAPFVPGQIILGVREGVSIEGVAARLGAKAVEALGGGRAFLLEVAGSAPSRAAEAAALPGVRFAEPNWLRELHVDPDDDGYPDKWDLHNGGDLCDGADCATSDADMDWQEAYDLLGSSISGSAIVAVVDTGVDLGHPDLDDKLAAGYDYLDGDDDPSDTYGHGTHVAGIAAAETNNGQGTAGVGYSPNITVMPLRVCDENGCPTSAIVEAIYHAANNGANVINLSLGGRFGSAAEEQAINYAWEMGLVIVASSGNDGSGKVSYPAAFPKVIAVGSTNWHDQLPKYSNRGNDLDVVAPGGDMDTYHDPGGIYSTMPTYTVYLTTTYSYSTYYDQLQGTSMAAPQVSGLAGLLFAMGVTDQDDDGSINDEIRGFIESTADDLGKPGWDRDFGWGRVNVYNAVLAAQGGPGPTPTPTPEPTPTPTPPPSSDVEVTSIDPNTMPAGTTQDVTISGSGFVDGAEVTFENGEGPAPMASVTSVSTGTITASVSAKSGGPPRNRVWDVHVTNPDGSNGVLVGGFTVTP